MSIFSALYFTAQVEDIAIKVIPERVIEDGENFLLVCSVGSGSLPIEFKFFQEYKVELLYRVTEKERRNTTWVIEGIASQDAAKYFCTANNQANLLAKSELVTVTGKLCPWIILPKHRVCPSCFIKIAQGGRTRMQEC